MIHIKKVVLVAAICMIFSCQVSAGSEIEILIDMLHGNGTISDAQYGRLMDEMRVSAEKIAEQKKQLQKQQEKVSNVALKVDKGGIQVDTNDGEFSAKIGGRVQFDAAWYDEDGTNMGNGTEIRRARLYLQGRMFQDWGYKLQYDFTGTGNRGIRDAFISYNGFEHVELKAGNIKDPFMLQTHNSSKYTTFNERSLVQAFAPGRHIGITASTKHRNWTASAGFFGDSVNTDEDGKDEGWGAAGRLTFAPINEKTRVIHLGFSADYRVIGDEQTVQFKQQPETHVSGVDIVDTGEIANVDNYLELGFEFAAVEGPFSFQSEYVWTTVQRDSLSDLDFDGWYAQAAYFLTGESRNYKMIKFAGVSPKSVVGRGGVGAWQIATRYSTINLNDAEIYGGEAESMTIGLNWFPTSTLRFSANYVRVLDVHGGLHDDEEPSLVQVRGAVGILMTLWVLENEQRHCPFSNY